MMKVRPNDATTGWSTGQEAFMCLPPHPSPPPGTAAAAGLAASAAASAAALAASGDAAAALAASAAAAAAAFVASDAIASAAAFPVWGLFLHGGGHQGGWQEHDEEGEQEASGGPLRVFAPLRQVCIWAIDADRSLLFKRQLVPQEEGGAPTGASLAEESQGAPDTAAQGSCFWKELMQAGASYVRSRLCNKEPLFFSVILFNAVSAAGGGAPLGGEQQGGPSGAPKGGATKDLVTPGIAVVLPLQEASISTIESLGALAALDRKAFDEAFPEPPQRPPFSDLWWTMGSLLLGAQPHRKRGGQQQRVFIFTSIPDPCSSSSSNSSSSSSSSSSSEEEIAVERNACIQRAHDLQSEQTEKWKTDVGGPPAGEVSLRSPSSREAPEEGAPEKEELQDSLEEAGARGAPHDEAINPQELTKVIEHGNKVIEVTDEEVNSIKAAIVCFIPRRGASVALAALTPQLQEVDERGVTLQSSGFHLHRLPFKEDLRAPHVPWSWADYSKRFVTLAKNPQKEAHGARTRADTSQEQEEEHALSVGERQMLQLIKQAADILKKLEISEFDVQQIPNAEKARQMAAIEAFALRLSVPAPQPDPLDFDKERFSLVDPLFLQWAERVRDAAPPVEHEGSRVKRKGGPSGGHSSRGEGASKRAPRWSGGEGPTDEDIRSLAASSQLERLTVPQLKSFLSRKRLGVGGHKADLVSRVLAHLP
ncbi:hypothetical protein ACSSS7_007593 [Eimeria intestinalis]